MGMIFIGSMPLPIQIDVFKDYPLA